MSDHPTEELRNWHPQDRLLREAGFRVVSRLRDEEAKWSRGGRVYSESQARELLNAEAVAAK